MRFNVAHLLRGSVGTSRRYSLDFILASAGDTQTDHVWGELQLMCALGGIWVHGLLGATAVCTCSRCLWDFSLSVRFQVDEVYVPVADITTDAFLSLSERTDSNFTIDEHYVLDISEAVRQSVILALPMKPLCLADCAGICPDCGVNRNEAHCHCESEQLDPRWVPLLRLSL